MYVCIYLHVYNMQGNEAHSFYSDFCFIDIVSCVMEAYQFEFQTAQNLAG